MILLHRLAEKLGRTVLELENTISVREMADWVCYFSWEAEQERKAYAKAERDAKARR